MSKPQQEQHHEQVTILATEAAMGAREGSVNAGCVKTHQPLTLLAELSKIEKNTAALCNSTHNFLTLTEENR